MLIVTGGAGFIGSATIWALNERGIDDILVVDNLGSGDKWKNLRALRYRDYLEKEAFREAVREQRFTETITAIVHLGACSATTEQDASYLVDNNYAYSQALAEFAIQHNIRFIYASSAATYGDGAAGYDDQGTDIDCLRPLNMYGYSKQMFDQWVTRQGHLERFAGLKFSNVFGPNEYHKCNMRSVVIRAFEQVRDSGTVSLFRSYRDDYADGEQMRDFIYVKDVVDMLLFFIDHPEVNGLFNIGSGQPRTWNDLATAVFKAMDQPARIEYIDMPATLRGRYQYYTNLPMAKLREQGYQRQNRSLEDAVSDYVIGYLQHDGYLEPSERS